MKEVKVAVWGFGAMGSGVVRALLGKKGVDVVGVCDLHPARVGKSIYEVLGVSRGAREEVLVCPDIDAVVRPGACDICVIATDSFTAKVYDKVMRVVEKGVNVVTTAEEMSYPAAGEPELTAKMDAAAKEQGVSVLGTGVNPGLIMDILALCLTGGMTDVQKVTCRRVNSLSPFGVAVMEEQGVGLPVAEFMSRVEDGTMAGHVGFKESVYMMDEALGLGVDKFEQQMSPIVTEVDRKSPYGFAKAGDVAGVNMTGQGLKNGAVVYDMIHPQQIEPELSGTHTGDYIELVGSPNISMAITPEVDGGIGTIAMCINMIPHVINARPGLRTMIDLPVPHAIMGDYRDMIDETRKIVK
ncbi:MAG: NADP-binding protein [Clostridia bacterium]|nr:NADP-binding protein [Clostridia bacterium]